MVLLTAGLLSAALAVMSVNAAPTKLKKVPGIAFDRFIAIWLENTDFAGAAADPNFQFITKQGIQLTNYFAVTHPSEPNYIASVGGEYFGMQNDNLNRVPQNVSTLVDLLEDKGISWAEYQQDMPSSGFQGFQFLNPNTGANDYVRKHNPLIIYDSVANNPKRANLIKNFTLFEQDLKADNLPQWMFITPNMTNDGHDTNITFASKFTRSFLEPLLKDRRFNDERTLIVLTFDENENEGGNVDAQNRVDTVLLGGAIPTHLIGTQDSTFYDHYSELSTVEANWRLHTLGRYDVGANVFKFVAEKTGDVIRTLKNPPLSETVLNASYPGVFSTDPGQLAPLPVPNTRLLVNGRSVLPQVVKTWGKPELQACTAYTNTVEVPSALNPPAIPAACLKAGI